jgi:hypothetical protein
MINHFFYENHAVYEIMWKNTVEPDSPRMTIWRMRAACLIAKATDKHSEYVIHIALPLQNGCTNAPQCYVATYNACLVCILWEYIAH